MGPRLSSLGNTACLVFVGFGSIALHLTLPSLTFAKLSQLWIDDEITLTFLKTGWGIGNIINIIQIGMATTLPTKSNMCMLSMRQQGYHGQI
jgi:hypothetical protein